MSGPDIGSMWVLPAFHFDRLLSILHEGGREVIGPIVEDGAIGLGPIDSINDLPIGIYDEHAPGHYRTGHRQDQAFFGNNVGQHAFKRTFLLPQVTLVRLRKNKNDIEILSTPPKPRPLALLGARACDLAALSKHDAILRDGPIQDTDYAARRADVLVVAVQCSQASKNCFCSTMNCGPKATQGFDLALTEIIKDEHRFIIEVGSKVGAAIVAQLSLEGAPSSDVSDAETIIATTQAQMEQRLPKEGLKEALANQPEHPHWDDIATRCLGCANCTMVCPTCFCTNTMDRESLEGLEAERTRVYDSCFGEGFAYVHGGSVRSSLKARYRQWLTHKLSSWVDQFGSMGCVGCGRCITFCPVGIDIAAEASIFLR